jgi:hypothetical protein
MKRRGFLCYTGSVLECARTYEYIVDRGVARRMRWDYGQIVLSEC